MAKTFFRWFLLYFTIVSYIFFGAGWTKEAFGNVILDVMEVVKGFFHYRHTDNKENVQQINK